MCFVLGQLSAERKVKKYSFLDGMSTLLWFYKLFDGLKVYHATDKTCSRLIVIRAI